MNLPWHACSSECMSMSNHVGGSRSCLHEGASSPAHSDALQFHALGGRALRSRTAWPSPYPRRHVCVKCVSPLGLRAQRESACVAGVPRCATRATFEGPEGDGEKFNYRMFSDLLWACVSVGRLGRALRGGARTFLGIPNSTRTLS